MNCRLSHSGLDYNHIPKSHQKKTGKAFIKVNITQIIGANFHLGYPLTNFRIDERQLFLSESAPFFWSERLNFIQKTHHVQKLVMTRKWWIIQIILSSLLNAALGNIQSEYYLLRFFQKIGLYTKKRSLIWLCKLKSLRIILPIMPYAKI